MVGHWREIGEKREFFFFYCSDLCGNAGINNAHAIEKGEIGPQCNCTFINVTYFDSGNNG